MGLTTRLWGSIALAVSALHVWSSSGHMGSCSSRNAEQRRQRRVEAENDEAMEQAIALSLAMAGGRDGGTAAHRDVVPRASARGEEPIASGALLHVYWDPAWDASESALRPGGTTYWSGDVNSALGPSEWISTHQDPGEDSIADQEVRARILRNHPALRDQAGAQKSEPYTVRSHR